jgi:hypothetical protein
MCLLSLKICRTCVSANDIESSLPDDNDWGWNINVFVIHNLSTLLFVVISWDYSTQLRLQYTAETTVHSWDCSTQLRLQYTAETTVHSWDCSTQLRLQYTAETTGHSWDCSTQSKIYYEAWNSFIILGTIKCLKIFVSNIIIRKCECSRTEWGGGVYMTLQCVTSTDISHHD